jgi:hypothetical protein
VTIRVAASPGAAPSDRDAAKASRELLAGELSRVRAGALAWRNGLAALLAGLVGFGLVKGRSDLTQLASPYAVVAGCLLAASLVVGASSALLLMRAAHGRPYAVALRKVTGGSAADRVQAVWQAEASASQKALRWGVVLCMCTVMLLAGTVGVTWYGPGNDQSLVEVQLSNGTRQCGEIVSLSDGRLTLKTPLGQIAVNLTRADGIAPVDSCPAQGG